MNWWRAHHGISHDPKLSLVAKRAKAKKCEVMAVWVSLLDYASQQEDRGSIAGIDYEEISFQTDISFETLQRIMSQFREKQMLDGSRLTAWDKRQYGESSTERVKRFREKKALNHECNGVKRDETDETRRETPVTLETPRTDTEQIQNRTDTHTEAGVRVRPIRAADLSGQTSMRFEEFWEKYPRKQYKAFACQEYLSVVTVENEAVVFACLDRYLASDEVSRGVVQNPRKWLYEQHRDNWAGDWPKVREPPKSKQQEAVDRWDRV